LYIEQACYGLLTISDYEALRRTVMLVLSRKTNEEIHIGSDITITLVAIQGNKVRIGIQAPNSVKILRAELASPHGEPEANKCSVAIAS
jgi:carbon storage regulator